MTVKLVTELMLDIIKKYHNDPTNWHILRSKDQRAYVNTFISHADKALWQLKTEWKNPFSPIGVGKYIKNNLNDEIQDLMRTGIDIPIHEVYPNSENMIIALGLGKYSNESTNTLTNLLCSGSGYPRKIEQELNVELEKILNKERIFSHYY